MTLRAVVLGCVLAACASAPLSFPAYYTAANSEHPQYPQARFIAGTGISSVSAEDAGARAKENVLLQISTRLESEISSFQLYTTKGETATSRVSVRSSFERADLIRLVDRASQGGTFYAYAVLDRAAADRELAAAMSADLTTFRAAAESAAMARAGQDTGAFEPRPLRQSASARALIPPSSSGGRSRASPRPRNPSTSPRATSCSRPS